MRKLFLMAFAFGLTSVASVSAQQTEKLSTSFTCKATYPKGKNIYLMDSCKVNYTIKKIVGKMGVHTDVEWTSRPDFTYNKIKVDRAQLNGDKNYQELVSRFDMITPKKATFAVTLMFYSDRAKTYFASAKTTIEVNYLEKAGATVSPETYTINDWSEKLTDVFVGKQSKPGVVTPDKSMKEFLDLMRLTESTTKMDPSQRGYNYRLRNIFTNADKIDIADAKIVSVDWNDDDYDFLVYEATKRKESLALMAKGDSMKASDVYYTNRKYEPIISMKTPTYWKTTGAPCEIFDKALNQADSYYKKKQWNEAGIYYNLAYNYDSTMAYPKQQAIKIQEYIDYKNNRNVTGLIDMIYVEGNHEVKSFYIGKTEVTQQQWARVMGTNPSNFKGCRTCPVENVSWDEVQQFIKKLNEQTGLKYRLMSEKEWEYAAKGGKNGSKSAFAGGDNLTEVSWNAYNAEQTTHGVAEKAPNELGIYDMTGNVAEWVNNQYDKTTRFVKGGSFADEASNCAIEAKEKLKPDYKSNSVGFRICQDE
ncbi:MAG: formylglycine-generating enzyme family protein [Paludibacteraceae bacterium]|nr:formylglycine-generating enzyme family protein [Paludibacteraceae bacterium]